MNFMNTGMRGRVVLFRLVLGLAVASFGTAAFAAIVGDLKTGSAGTMTVTLLTVGFNVDPSAVGGGNAEVATGTSLTFAGCASGVLGSPGCLSVAEGITVFSPLTSSTVLPVTSYLTFAAHPNVVYSLASVAPGSANTNCAAAVNIGDSCSIFAGSPLLLTRTATGTTMTFAVSGKASDTGVGGLAAGSNYEGAFVGPAAGLTPSQIQLFFCPSGTCMAADFTSGRSVTTSQSGDFLATAPITTPTNTPTNTPTSTPTNTPTNTQTNLPTNTPTVAVSVPTLSPTPSLLLALVLASVALLLMRRNP